MIINENEISLYHHGILGQKWGIRRKNPSNSKSSNDKDVSKMTKEERKALILKKVDVRLANKYKKEFTNKELRDFLERASNEIRLKDLAEKAEPKRKTAKDVIKTILDNSDLALRVANNANSWYTVYNSPGGKALRKKIADKG